MNEGYDELTLPHFDSFFFIGAAWGTGWAFELIPGGGGGGIFLIY